MSWIMSQVLPQPNLGRPPHTRPTLKPPYLDMNLEDKDQVNPSAMVGN
jgi:hypothetical protein